MVLLRFIRVLALRILTWHLHFLKICAILLYDLPICTYKVHLPPDQKLKKSLNGVHFVQSVKNYLKKRKLASQHILPYGLLQQFSVARFPSCTILKIISVRNFVKIGQLIQNFKSDTTRARATTRYHQAYCLPF